MNELGLPTHFGPQARINAKRNICNNKQPRLSSRVECEVDEVFNKWFSFYSGRPKNASKHNGLKLPEPSSLFQEDKWKLEPFQQLKTSLNNTKSKLNDLNLKDWHLHTAKTNIAGDVIKKLRYEVGPEFLTQAWCKMYECLMKFSLVPNTYTEGVLNSVHLCEAPGAFITALHHFLQTRHPWTQWNWLATTLNPYHESNPLSHMIQDDRFILHTLSHWTFGKDGTGNLMDRDNLHHLEQEVNAKLEGNVMLVTADGSIDCQINPAEQEALVAPLHYCETLTALTILQPGGSFLLKMFTLLECDSICLLYLLTCVFQRVSVFKPVKSKEGNSEVYVICSEYVGRNQLVPWLPVLYEEFGPTISKAMFCEKDIPQDFKDQIYDCAKMFTHFQVGVIERNLDLYHSFTAQKQFHSRQVKKRVSEVYIERYQLQRVDKVIVGNHVLADTATFNIAQKHEEGTFNDRVRNAYLDQPGQIEQLWASVQEEGGWWTLNHNTCWFRFSNRKLPQLEISYGQPVLSVVSSKFCNGRILHAYSQVMSGRLLSTTEAEVQADVIVDVSQFPWDLVCSYCHIMLLECLTLALQDLPEGKSLCLRGVPLFTQITVSVVFLLAHSFNQVGLSVDGNVILYGYRGVFTCDWTGHVLSLMRALPPGRAVLSILPINLLCDASYCTGDGNSFYMTVSNINNARLMQSLQAEAQKAMLTTGQDSVHRPPSTHL